MYALMSVKSVFKAVFIFSFEYRFLEKEALAVARVNFLFCMKTVDKIQSILQQTSIKNGLAWNDGFFVFKLPAIVSIISLKIILSAISVKRSLAISLFIS